jgi:hypothetical protein
MRYRCMPVLDSSAIRSAYYDKDRAVLTLIFEGRDGGTYEYYAVPRRIYDGLLTADSAGAYFNQEIRDRYPFKKRE